MTEYVNFHIAVDDKVKNNESKLSDYLTDELQTKTEIVFNVWADTGRPNIENLGSCRVCLS